LIPRIFEKPSKKPKIEKLDQLFIDYLEDLTSFCDKNYSNYNFYNPAIKLRRFLWDIFASNYIEVVKPRAYNQKGNFSAQESDSAKWTLHFLLERMLSLFYPIIPQITSLVGKAKNLDLLFSDFPTANVGDSNLSLVEDLIGFNSQVWKEKKEKGISLRDPIGGFEIPGRLKDFEKDLKMCHGID